MLNQPEVSDLRNYPSLMRWAGMKQHAARQNDMVNHLVENPFTEGSEFRERILEALNEIKTELTSTT